MQDYGYINAAPLVNDTGINDKSFRMLPTAVTNIPQHLPKFYVRASKGPVGDNYVDFNVTNLNNLYGAESFEEGSKFFTHQVPFITGAAGHGNNMVIHRVIGPDAEDVANVTIYVDVAKADVVVYEKNEDGSLVYDAEGLPVPAEEGKTIPGVNITFVLDHTKAKVGEYRIGQNTIRAGIQTGTDGTSKQYPLLEISARDIGDEGRLISVILSALTERDGRQFPEGILSEGNIYPYNFSLAKLVDEMSGETNPIRTIRGSENITFSFAKDAKDPRTKSYIDLETLVENMYIDVPIERDSGIGGIHVYHENYELLTKMFYDLEVKHTDEFSDFNLIDGEENYNAINILSFVNSNGSPYNALKLVDVTGGVRLTRNSNNYLEGGSDGAMDNDYFDKYVARDLKNYSDPLHPYQNHVKHPETIFYDTGFTIDTKLELGNFIALRKNTMVVATSSVDGENLTFDEEASLAVNLETMFRLYPESAFWGTGVCRGLVMSTTAKLTSNAYRTRVPSTYHLLDKAADYMGASSGDWKQGKLFDHGQGSEMTSLKDLSNDWVPSSARNALWDANLNFPLTKTRRLAFIPSLKTVCKDDTSVLNNFFTVMAAIELNKIGYASWMQFSGVMSLTDDQLCERVDEFIAEAVLGKFDGLFAIRPRTVVTERDAQRGFSWTTVIELYSNVSKTATTLTIETYRFSDFEQ